MRVTNSATSSPEKASLMDGIGTPWRTGAKVVDGGAPTRSDGESGRTSWGKRASSSALRRFTTRRSPHRLSAGACSA